MYMHKYITKCACLDTDRFINYTITMYIASCICFDTLVMWLHRPHNDSDNIFTFILTESMKVFYQTGCQFVHGVSKTTIILYSMYAKIVYMCQFPCTQIQVFYCL